MDGPRSYNFSYSPPDVRLSTVNPADRASLVEGAREARGVVAAVAALRRTACPQRGQAVSGAAFAGCT